jgi:hypothetical protein
MPSSMNDFLIDHWVTVVRFCQPIRHMFTIGLLYHSKHSIKTTISSKASGSTATMALDRVHCSWLSRLKTSTLSSTTPDPFCGSHHDVFGAQCQVCQTGIESKSRHPSRHRGIYCLLHMLIAASVEATQQELHAQSLTDKRIYTSGTYRYPFLSMTDLNGLNSRRNSRLSSNACWYSRHSKTSGLR